MKIEQAEVLTIVCHQVTNEGLANDIMMLCIEALDGQVPGGHIPACTVRILSNMTADAAMEAIGEVTPAQFLRAVDAFKKDFIDNLDNRVSAFLKGKT